MIFSARYPIAIALLLFALIGGDPVSAQSGATNAFFVATSGNDSWSGRYPAPNADHTDGPFATLQRAQRAVRAASAQATGSVTVTVRQGVYWLTEPLTLTAEDSGKPNAPILYRAYPGERPVISGGIRLHGWTQTAQGRWQVTLPEVAKGAWRFSQLFVNGEQRYRPRLPKQGYYEIAAAVPPTQAFPGGGDNRFRFTGNEIKPDWYDLKSVEVLPFLVWSMSRFPIAAVDPTTRTVTIDGHTLRHDASHTFVRGHRFLVENVREALRQPGEWYLDRLSGTMTYLARPGENPNTDTVVAPRLETLIKLDGVSQVSFQGLTFTGTGWNLPPSGINYHQGDISLPATVELSNSAAIRFERCTVEHTGAWAFNLGTGVRHCLLSHLTLTDLGAGGVKIGEVDYKTEATLPTDNTVTDCRIMQGGRFQPSASGIWVGHAARTRLLHNEVADFYYSGISVGWTWGYTASPSRDNEIAFNHVHDIGRGVLSDLGGIYTLGVSPGTVIHHNRIHDIQAYDSGGWGIYLDEGSSHILVENNLVYRTKSGGFQLHFGRDNRVQNNIFAFGRENQLSRARGDENLSFSFAHNIVVWSEGDLFLNRGDLTRVKFSDNLYWHSGAPFVLPDGLSFTEWQRAGNDADSLIADPRFVAMDTNDFRLRTDSPARRIGFVPFDLSTVGPRETPSTATASASRQERQPLPAFPITPLPPHPPRPVNDGFEDYDAGSKPEVPGMAINEEAETPTATIRVTEEAAHSGKRSLQFTDAPGQRQPFYPYLFYSPDFGEGVGRATFSLRLESGARFSHEWRDAEKPYHAGPSFAIDAEGTLTAGKQRLAKLPISRWLTFEIRCGLGTKANGTFDLTVHLPDGVAPLAFKDLPCPGGKAFTRLAWCGFTASATTNAVFYLDDVSLTLE